MEELVMETDTSPQILEPEPEVMSIGPELHPAPNDETCFQYPALFTSKTLLELSSSSWSRSLNTWSLNTDVKVQPYLRGCKWSPDGTCCLSVVNHDGIHVTELPRELYDGGVKSDRMIDVLDSVIHVKEAGTIYDFCWYPGMNSAMPENCCWLTTRQNAPIQMWDAFDGSLRCSYRGYNWVDEMENALSVTFTPDGQRIVGGYKKTLKTFDVERPGRDFTEHKISCPASCLAADSNLLAVGSWNTSITLYNVSEMGTYKSIGKMHGHGGGVTHMKFTPDGLKLVTGARKDHRLLVWDIRYYRRPLNILSRSNTTNQRIYFDISPCGKYLVSGATDGIVKVWDVDQVDWKNSLDSDNMEGDNVTYKFPLHQDCCNSISIHPFRPILATGSGQLHLEDPTNQDDCSTVKPILNLEIPENRIIPEPESETLSKESRKQVFSSASDSESDSQRDYVRNKIDRNRIKDVQMDNCLDMKYSSYAENSLIFWWTGEVPGLT